MTLPPRLLWLFAGVSGKEWLQHQRYVLQVSMEPARYLQERGAALPLSGMDAYLAAYPKSTRKAAETGASRMLRNAKVKAEIQAMRDKADLLAGSAVLTFAEKRKWLARLVRADLAEGQVAGDLWQGSDVELKAGGRKVLKIRLADKLTAIKLDNDLAGDGAEAKAMEIIVRRAWMTPA